MNRVVIMTRQIGHYHEARFSAVSSSFDDFVVLSVVNDADFSEFLSCTSQDYKVVRIFPDQVTYEGAVASGRLATVIRFNLSRLDPSVVVVPGWASPESFAAIAWAHRAKRRVVVVSDSQSHDAERTFAREYVKSRIVRLCHAALVGGRSHAEYIESLGMPFNRVHMGYDVVDNSHFTHGADTARLEGDHARQRYGLPPRYVLASGRFVAKKNFPALIRAYAKAREKWIIAPDLVILGDGPERPVIERTIDSVGLNHKIHLAGFRALNALPAFYGLSEGFLHASLVEQWGLVINEAAAAGVPLVVSRHCGAAPELVVEGVNGFNVDPTSSQSIEQGICKLFSLSEASRNAMGLVSRSLVSSWDLDRFVAGMRGAVSDAVAAPESRIRLSDHLLLRYLIRKTIDLVH